ncbi:hypothetical protein ATANTOWER_030505 [Ataeniobius toweri]|uniref:Transposase n=1 Tax=Ataeniobius toweri TaxID=208326 RepID=A0ABU7ASI7_9TELE|nr:hypothetical protein [Ataeniobius toweri]
MFDYMVKKYGPKSTECINEWVKKFYFPADGSFNLSILQKIEEAINKREVKLERQKRVYQKDLQALKKRKACLQCWKEEPEKRQRKKYSKLMAGSQDDSKNICGRQDNCSISAPILENSTEKSEASIHVHNPPPYSTFATSNTPVNSSSVSHSLYHDVRALATLAAVVDQDLDTGVFA